MFRTAVDHTSIIRAALRLLVVPICGLVLFAEESGVAFATSYTYDNNGPNRGAVPGRWDDPLNWQPYGVPRDENDEATISGNGWQLWVETVKLKKLTLGPGYGVSAQSLSVTETFNWTGGTLTGDFSVVTGGSLQIEGTSQKGISAGRFANAGIATWSGPNVVLWGNATRKAEFINDALGVRMNITTDSDRLLLHGSNGSDRSRFVNEGTLRKASGNGTVGLEVGLENRGVVEVASGTLKLAAVAGVDQHAMRTGSRLQGGGKLLVSTDFVGGIVIEPDVELATGSTLELFAGTRTGNGPFKGQGHFLWTGGDITGDFSVPQTATMRINGPGDKTLRGRLSNMGTATWVGSGKIILKGSAERKAELVNAPLGRFNVENDAGLALGSGVSGQSVILNQGILRKQKTTGTTSIDVPVLNSGIVELSSGTLALTHVAGNYRQIAGETRLRGGTFVVQRPMYLEGGKLTGSGRVDGAISNTGGVVAPGNTTGFGLLTIERDYIQSGGGRFEAKVGGFERGAGGAMPYDRLKVTGVAAIDGGLRARFVNGYQPVTGDGFVLVAAAGGLQQGNVAAELPALRQGLHFTQRWLHIGLGGTVNQAHSFVLRVDGGAEADEASDVALLIWVNNRVTLAETHDSGVVDAATARDNIRDAARGRPAARSNYGTAPGGSVRLDARVLQLLLTFLQTSSLSVSELAGGSHGSGSHHYAGRAVDVNVVGGRHVSLTDPALPLQRMCAALGATEVLRPGDPGHDTHVHCAWTALIGA